MQTPSESTDVKLDALNEPSAHLIVENVALPEDTFRSYWSYLLYEMAHYKPTMFTIVITVSLILLLVFFHDKETCVLVSMLLLILMCPLISMAAIIAFNHQTGDIDFKVKLLMEIITRKPAVEGKEWRTITYQMNQYLFDNDLWNTPYYFYRDKDCYRYFLKLIEGQTFKKPENLPTSDVTDIERNEATTGAPDERTESFTFSTESNYRKFLFKAAEVEQQAQNNYWQERYPEINAIV
ncbi:Prm9p [Saccharomyces cerevisiae YJM1444]|nr:Prm9p [Saccharomyces cerevisiae YJM1444]